MATLITLIDKHGNEIAHITANIAAIKRNSFLRLLFPAKYWDSDVPLRFRFRREFLKELEILSSMFLKSIKENTPFEHQGAKEAYLFANHMTEILLGLSLPPEREDYDFYKRWIEQIFDFFRKGIELEERGMEPKIEISY